MKPEFNTGSSITPIKYFLLFPYRLKELEEKERKEAESKFERISAKSSSAPKRDPKQILKAYKSTERKTDPKDVEVNIQVDFTKNQHIL